MTAGNPGPKAGANPSALPAEKREGGQRRVNFARNYGLASLAFVMVLIVTGILHNDFHVARTAYVAVLFALCAGPYFLAGRNPKHRLLAMYMACYFAVFGMAAFFYLIDGELPVVVWGTGEVTEDDLANITTADAVIVLGALMTLAGYFFLQKLRGPGKSNFLAYEWRYSTVLKTGVMLWCVGFAYMLAYDTTASVYYIPKYVLGLPVGVASNLKLMAPLGALMLIYLITRDYLPKVVWTLLVTMMAAEFVFGFISSSKETSFRIAALLLLGLYFLRGRVSFRILAVIVVVSIPYLLYFNAYRYTMMEQHYLNSGAALKGFAENMEEVKRRTSGAEDVADSSLGAIGERIDGKRYVDIITTGTDSGKQPFLYGKTLSTFFASWIPRMFWPEKPDISTGQMFNRAFKLSASRLTMVPTTIPGELYWNFAMPGVIIGMFVIGMIFGSISSAVSGGSGMTLPRFLILLLATYFLAMRIEGNVATQYSTFLRLVILIWAIDKFYRWRGLSRRIKAPPKSPDPSRMPPVQSAPAQPGSAQPGPAQPGVAQPGLAQPGPPSSPWQRPAPSNRT